MTGLLGLKVGNEILRHFAERERSQWTATYCRRTITATALSVTGLERLEITTHRRMYRSLPERNGAHNSYTPARFTIGLWFEKEALEISLLDYLEQREALDLTVTFARTLEKGYPILIQ